MFKLSSFVISRKTNEPNFKEWQKNLILVPILVHLTPPQKMFFVGFTSTGCLALWQDIVCSFKEN